jgi:hypothetical protein
VFLDEGSDASLYFAFRQRPYGLIYDFAVSVEEHGGHSSYVVRCRRSRRVVDIDLREFHLAFECLSQFIQNRFEASAVASPGCRKVDEHGPLEIDDFPLKIAVGYVHGPAGVDLLKIEGFLALPAFQAIGPSAPGNAIFGPARGAYNNDRFVAHEFLLTMLYYGRGSTSTIFETGVPDDRVGRHEIGRPLRGDRTMASARRDMVV